VHCRIRDGGLWQRPAGLGAAAAAQTEAVAEPGAAPGGAAMLDKRYWPEQAAGRLDVLCPGEAAMRVSHETICQSSYVSPRRELAHPRRGLQPISCCYASRSLY
jgi:hypothetical protein